ncbi:MAG: hypothetical protein ABH834_01590 [Candidatus Altiarchaeota archaeon]
MGARRFSNQDAEQVLKHLGRLLSPHAIYNLCVDPLGIYFEIRESTRRAKKGSEKRDKLNEQIKGFSKGKRKRFSTNKRTRPKIRTVKKGRTVSLKGRVY